MSKLRTKRAREEGMGQVGTRVGAREAGHSKYSILKEIRRSSRQISACKVMSNAF